MVVASNLAFARDSYISAAESGYVSLLIIRIKALYLYGFCNSLLFWGCGDLQSQLEINIDAIF